MKKLFYKIILLTLPVILFIIIFKVEEIYRYEGLKKECSNHAIWLYKRIKKENKPIDLAFIGTSHTMNAINVSVFNKTLKDNLIAANLGYCRLGRDLHYHIFKLLLKNKQPKHLILEVRSEEKKSGHPVFPYLSKLPELFTSPSFYNKRPLKKLFQNLSFKTDIIQDQLFDDNINKTKPTMFSILHIDDTASIQELIAKKNENKKNKTKTKDIGKIPKAYLNKIFKLCNKNNIVISFIYLPSYGQPHRKPVNYKYYRQYGKVYIPPSHILDDPDNWYDDNHLNMHAGIKVSTWLAEELIQN